MTETRFIAQPVQLILKVKGSDSIMWLPGTSTKCGTTWIVFDPPKGGGKVLYRALQVGCPL